MRSKKMAVRFGLLSVLLLSLGAAAVPNLARTSPGTISSDVARLNSTDLFCNGRPATPEFSWDISWRGWVKLYMSCDTRGATIKYTTDGSNPSLSSPTYENPLYLFWWMGIDEVRAAAYKCGKWSRYMRILYINWG